MRIRNNKTQSNIFKNDSLKTVWAEQRTIKKTRLSTFMSMNY